MKKQLTIVLAGLTLMLLLPLQGFGAKWEVDPAHSAFYFTVDHIYSKVRGHFNTYTAEIDFDPQQPAAGKFAFVIEVDSIDTNIAKRDKHLVSPDFFDAGAFPQMKFVSTSVKDLGGGNLEVTGKLTVKGKDHDFTLPLHFAGVKDHPAVQGKQVIGFNGTVVLDRLALGVGSGKFYKMGLVGKDVEVLVTLEALSQ